MRKRNSRDRDFGTETRQSEKEESAIRSWLWKRIPRTSDRDKTTFRRLLNRNFHSSLYQKRWFQFDPNESMLSYFREQPLGDSDKLQPAGSIPISQIVSVQRKQSGVEDTAPNQHVFDIICQSRTYCLCAPDQETLQRWIAVLSSAVAIEAKTRKRSEDISARRASSRDLRMSEVRHVKQLQPGNVEAQAAIVSTLSETMEYEYWTGNLPTEALSLFSETDLESFLFYKQMSKCCKQRSPRQAMDRLLQKAQYRFFDEGDIMQKGSNSDIHVVESVFLLIEGGVIRVKEMNNEELPLGTVQTGQWVGAVEHITCGAWISDYVCEINSVAIEFPVEALEELLNDPDFPTLRKELSGQIHEITQQILLGLPLFEDIAAPTLLDLSRNFKMEFYKSGATLFCEGQEADRFFIVVAGVGNITKLVDSEPMLLFTSRAGDYFGELGLLKDQPRGATVTSLGGLVCLHVCKKGFQNMLHLGGSVIQRRIHDHVGEQMNRFIQSIDIFADLDSHFATIAEGMTFKHLPPGHLVARQGEPIDGFYSITSGHISRILEFVETSYDLEGRPEGQSTSRIHIASDLDLPLELGQLLEQDTFGDVSQLYRNAVAHETYITKTSCLLLFVPRAHFQRLLSICPELKRRLNSKFKFQEEEASQFQMKVDSIVRALGDLAFSKSPVPAGARNTSQRRRSMSSMQGQPLVPVSSSSGEAASQNPHGSMQGQGNAEKLANIMRTLPKDLKQAVNEL